MQSFTLIFTDIYPVHGQMLKFRPRLQNRYATWFGRISFYTLILQWYLPRVWTNVEIPSQAPKSICDLIWSNLLLYIDTTMISTPFMDKCWNSVPGSKIDMRLDLVESPSIHWYYYDIYPVIYRQMLKFCSSPQKFISLWLAHGKDFGPYGLA